MATNNVAFDIDGVFLNTYDHFNKMVENQFNDEVLISNSYVIKTKHNMPTFTIIEIFDQVIEDYNNIPIFEGATDLVTRIYERTKDPIRFVTARPQHNADCTYKAVERFCPVPFMIGFSNDAKNTDASNNKIGFLEGIEHFVEDRRKTAIELAEQGKTVFLVDRHYNQADFNGLSNRIHRIYGLGDLIPFVNMFTG